MKQETLEEETYADFSNDYVPLERIILTKPQKEILLKVLNGRPKECIVRRI
jgi:hypothetical protein